MQGASKKKKISLEYFDLSKLSDGQITAELSALQFQHKFYLRELGTLLPKKIPSDEIHTVLDLVCSAGTWCTDFIKQYPDKSIVGVDMDEKITNFARENAATLPQQQIDFQVAKSLPLALFADETFDLIHLQNAAGLFPIEQWPEIIVEMYRLLKPGGWLYLVDFEIGPASTPAMDRVLSLLGQITWRLGLNVSPNGMMPYNSCALGPQRMAQGGLTDINYELHPVNLGGWNNPMGRTYLTSHVVRPEMIYNYGVATGVSTLEELHPLVHEMLREVQQIGFCSVLMLISTIGRKPLKI